MKRPWFPECVELEGQLACRIPLTRGLFALTDQKYLAPVLLHSWYAKLNLRTTYAATNKPLGGGKLFLHQLIWELMGNTGPADHKNSNGLDCRECNLRPGPPRLNNANAQKRLGASSRYKGVSWATDRSKWLSQIQIEGNNKYLGLFTSEEAAARAYDTAALAAWGAYAKLNFLQAA